MRTPASENAWLLHVRAAQKCARTDYGDEGVFRVLCPKTSGGTSRTGAGGTPRSEPVIRKTLLSALGAGTLLLGAVATGAPAADAAPSGLHAKRVCAASTQATVASCLSKVLVNSQGAVPHSATPAAGAKTPA